MQYTEKRETLRKDTAWKLNIDGRIALKLLTGFVWFMVGTSDSLICL
jgi:hypothetical protein